MTTAISSLFLEYIQQLQNQVNAINPKQNQAKKAKEEADDLKDLSKLFKPVQDMPKVAAGKLFLKNQIWFAIFRCWS